MESITGVSARTKEPEVIGHFLDKNRAHCLRQRNTANAAGLTELPAGRLRALVVGESSEIPGSGRGDRGNQEKGERELHFGDWTGFHGCNQGSIVVCCVLCGV